MTLAYLIQHLENLGPTKRTWLKKPIVMTCFFSTPERVAIAKAGIQKWLDGADRGMKMNKFHFTERYWACTPQ